MFVSLLWLSRDSREKAPKPATLVNPPFLKEKTDLINFRWVGGPNLAFRLEESLGCLVRWGALLNTEAVAAPFANKNIMSGDLQRTVDAETDYRYRKIGGGIIFQKHYIFLVDLSLIRLDF